MIIVSACLAGVECRYNGQAFPIPAVIEMVKRGLALPICPEVLGGMPTKRPPAEQRKGRVFSADGQEFTTEFVTGAQISLQIALLIGCKEAILKSRSPSCGCGMIYDGSFSGQLVSGDGIFCKLLKESGIKTCTEEEIMADCGCETRKE